MVMEDAAPPRRDAAQRRSAVGVWRVVLHTPGPELDPRLSAEGEFDSEQDAEGEDDPEYVAEPMDSAAKVHAWLQKSTLSAVEPSNAAEPECRRSPPAARADSHQDATYEDDSSCVERAAHRRQHVKPAGVKTSHQSASRIRRAGLWGKPDAVKGPKNPKTYRKRKRPSPGAYQEIDSEFEVGAAGHPDAEYVDLHDQDRSECPTQENTDYADRRADGARASHDSNLDAECEDDPEFNVLGPGRIKTPEPKNSEHHLHDRCDPPQPSIECTSRMADGARQNHDADLDAKGDDDPKIESEPVTPAVEISPLRAHLDEMRRQRLAGERRKAERDRKRARRG